MIGIFTTVLAGNTIFLGSQHVAAGHTVNRLQSQKADLDRQALALKQELGLQIASQAMRTKAESQGFIAIAEVDQLDLSQVASAQ